MVDEDLRRRDRDRDRDRDSGDIVLAPNEWLLVRDRTKGDVNVYVGPCKLTISDTDRPVVFDEKTKRFVDTEISKSIQPFSTAPEGYYVVLKNPAYTDKGEQKHPGGQGKASPADLIIGRKVNIPGPASFPLFPGQMAKVLKGHNLRSNQYLLVRVYDVEAATKNWESGIVVAQEGSESDASTQAPPHLTMGQLLVIKGTDVAFYIPPTGIEVVSDPEGKLVREAVTLERLEYCLLRDESGGKRFQQGPAVVFPNPTEVFDDRPIERDGQPSKIRKFRAIELNENSGIYIKIIADYKEGEKEYRQGTELFITGRDQMIYFPREEHAIVRYDSSEIHYGIAIPAGEARYVLDRNKGDISLIKGPTIFLPDPRYQVVIRRVLDYKTCNLLYPDNQAAVEHNATLAGVSIDEYAHVAVNALEGALLRGAVAASAGPITSSVMAYGGATGVPGIFTSNLVIGDTAQARGLAHNAAKGFSGDVFQRKAQYTEPRTITLSTKFDGAVTSDIWPGYAMMLVSKSGTRRVVMGPSTIFFEYDEQPQVLTLSRGKPKTTDNLLKTTFLLTRANKVSDIVEVETSDYCKLKVKVSYRVNFEGDSEKWFSVENYTKFMCDHLRSKLRTAIRKIGIEQFYGGAESVVREVVLGKSVDPESGKVNARPGTRFEENGMHVYDVEVLGVELDNKDIAADIANSQKEVIKHSLTLASNKRALNFTIEAEHIKQEQLRVTAETVKRTHELEQEKLTAKLQLDLAVLDAIAQSESEKRKQALAAEQSKQLVAAVNLSTLKAESDQAVALEQLKQDQRKAWLEAEVRALVEKASAIQPDLIAALNSFGERELIQKVAESMAPLSIIKETGFMDILGGLLKGTNLSKHLLGEAPNGTGSSAKATTART